MLWAVWHEWPSGAKFTFNCYHHWATLVVRDTVYGSGHFLRSKEVVTQGDPLSMIEYGIGVLSLIRELWTAHLQVTQPWYSDDLGAGGMFQQVQEHFQDLQAKGTAWGYYPGPIKSILVVAPGNVAQAEEHFRGLGIWVVTGHQYLGGFIGDADAERRWLREKAGGGRSQ